MEYAPSLPVGSPHCPKCGIHTSYNPSGQCASYHANNQCPLRSAPERLANVLIVGVEATCGELMDYHRTGQVPNSLLVRAHEDHHPIRPRRNRRPSATDLYERRDKIAKAVLDVTFSEARELAKWAGARIPNGPTAGFMKEGHVIGHTGDLDLALAMIIARVREEK